MSFRKPEAWQIRKLSYGLAALLVGVLGWAGVLSEIQADQIADQVDQWLPIVLGVIAPALAASKTNPGSDSTVTVADVAAAAHVSADAVADAVARRLTDAATYGEHAKGIASVADYYRGE